MGLSLDDLWSIRDIIKDEISETFQNEGRLMMQGIIQKDVREIVHDAVNFELDSLKGRVTAQENDIKEIYFILSRLEKKIAH